MCDGRECCGPRNPLVFFGLWDTYLLPMRHLRSAAIGARRTPFGMWCVRQIVRVYMLVLHQHKQKGEI